MKYKPYTLNEGKNAKAWKFEVLGGREGGGIHFSWQVPAGKENVVPAFNWLRLSDIKSPPWLTNGDLEDLELQHWSFPDPSLRVSDLNGLMKTN